jgi:hypothetical protein
MYNKKVIFLLPVKTTYSCFLLNCTANNQFQVFAHFLVTNQFKFLLDCRKWESKKVLFSAKNVTFTYIYLTPTYMSSRRKYLWLFMFVCRNYFVRCPIFQDHCRVARLGEFSPNGLLFSLGSGLKTTEEAHISGLLFSHCTSYVRKNFDKKWIGLHFGRLFHKLIWSPWTTVTLQDHLSDVYADICITTKTKTWCLLTLKYYPNDRNRPSRM